jgi:hypothetical protein
MTVRKCGPLASLAWLARFQAILRISHCEFLRGVGQKANEDHQDQPSGVPDRGPAREAGDGMKAGQRRRMGTRAHGDDMDYRVQ